MLICNDKNGKTLGNLPAGTVYKIRNYNYVYLVTEKNESMFNITTNKHHTMNSADRKGVPVVYPNACLELGDA